MVVHAVRGDGNLVITHVQLNWHLEDYCLGAVFQIDNPSLDSL